MRALPLYQETRSVLETTEPLDLNPQCTRCVLASNAMVKKACIGAWASNDNFEGGVLIVGEGPGRDENNNGLPFVGVSGKLLKSTVQRYYKGPAVYDNAIRCYPAGKELSEKHVDACRGYLAQTFREMKPSRIIALGNSAIQSILGRSPPIMSIRRGYAWLGNGTPVFFVFHPAAALRNHFVRKWFEEDLQWALTVDPNTLYQPVWDAVAYEVTAESVQDAVADLRDSEWVAYDTETSGAQWNPEFTLLCLSIAKKGAQDVYIWGREALKDSQTRQPLIDLLADPRVKKWGQNVKYDNVSVRCYFGTHVNGVVGDTRLFRRLQDTESTAKLEVLAELIGMGGHKEEAGKAVADAVKLLRKAIRKSDKSLLSPFKRSEVLVNTALEKIAEPHKDDPKRYAFGFIDENVLLPYNARDTLSTARVAELVDSRMNEEPELRKTFNDIVWPAVKAFERMEENGILVDQDSLKAFSSILAFEQMGVMSRLKQYGDIKWNSPKQLGELLFGKLKLPVVAITDSGFPSTGEDALKTLEGRHPIIPDLLKFRKLEKLQGGYGQGLFKHIRGDGRVHSTFNPDGAASGRGSSQDPNMQNIPSPSNDKKEGPFYGKMSRDVYVAPQGWCLIQGDYSQLELRVACGLSQDPVMTEVFLMMQERLSKDPDAEADFHLETAKLLATIFGFKPEEVNKKHWLRSSAKVINFALLYGKSDAGIAHDISIASGSTCTIQQAAKIREAILGRFNRLKQWIDESLSYARKTGHCWTWFNGTNARRRSLYRIADQETETRGNAERSSWNTRIQGTGSDFCMRSLSAVQEWLEADCFPGNLILTVHDSIMLEVQDEFADEAARTLSKLMAQWPLNGVPVIVDIEIGRAWGTMQKCKDLNKPILGYLS